jgi:hypothetical protein
VLGWLYFELKNRQFFTFFPKVFYQNHNIDSRYKNFSATVSSTPTKDYLSMGSLLARTPLRKGDGAVDDDDYLSDDEIVYCGEESLDEVRSETGLPDFYW